MKIMESKKNEAWGNGGCWRRLLEAAAAATILQGVQVMIAALVCKLDGKGPTTSHKSAVYKSGGREGLAVILFENDKDLCLSIRH